MTLVPILAFDEIDSTSAEARRRAEAGETGPLWITAARQTAGRGRRGRNWSTEPGNLAATLLDTTDLPPVEAAQISFIAALAVCDLAPPFPSPRLGSPLKWPNDLMIDGKKAAGILVESGQRPDGRLWLAVGIGVNLAHSPDLPRPAHRLLRRAPPPRPPRRARRWISSRAPSPPGWGCGAAQGFTAIAEAWTVRAHGLGQPCVARPGSEALHGDRRGARHRRRPAFAARGRDHAPG